MTNTPPTDPAVPDTYIPSDANLHNTPVNNSDSLTSVPDELRKQITAIKKRATDKFHNDHADGDLAIYDVVREMTALFTQYARQARLDEVNRIPHRLLHIKEVCDYQVSRIAQLTATPHGGEDK